MIIFLYQLNNTKFNINISTVNLSSTVLRPFLETLSSIFELFNKLFNLILQSLDVLRQKNIFVVQGFKIPKSTGLG